LNFAINEFKEMKMLPSLENVEAGALYVILADTEN
jgi:hypothetical protein